MVMSPRPRRVSLILPPGLTTSPDGLNAIACPRRRSTADPTPHRPRIHTNDPLVMGRVADR